MTVERHVRGDHHVTLRQLVLLLPQPDLRQASRSLGDVKLAFCPALHAHIPQIESPFGFSPYASTYPRSG
ncbi:MAG: hypothetical protein WAK56_08445, partial [Candidatus Sulfotelmatobacter sp.]